MNFILFFFLLFFFYYYFYLCFSYNCRCRPQLRPPLPTPCGKIPPSCVVQTMPIYSIAVSNDQFKDLAAAANYNDFFLGSNCGGWLGFLGILKKWDCIQFLWFKPPQTNLNSQAQLGFGSKFI